MIKSCKDIIPDKLNKPARFAKIADRHLKAFNWENQGWIPLGLVVNNPEYSRGITLDQWLNPQVFMELQAKILRDTLEVGSDIMPSIAINHMGNALYSSVFGAKITVPQDKITSIQDSGPWVYPALKSIEEVDDLSEPTIPSALIFEAERYMKFCREHLPSWVKVVSPSKLGPFSLAELIRGSEFYLELASEPDRCRRLLELCTNSLIEIERYLREVVNQGSNEHYSEFAIRGPGLRIADDSIINISPDMIKQFVLPHIDRMAQAFGGLTYVHFCTLDKSRSEHVYPALADDRHVCAASSQFAFEYYEKNVDNLEHNLAIESLYGNGIEYVIDKYGSFEKWAVDFVPRFKNRSGLILYFEVDSIDEGKTLWEIWQKAHKL